MARIKLLTVPYIDINYNNVIDFENKQQMINYFGKKEGILIDKNIKPHSNITSMVVELNIDEVQQFDYLIVDYKYFYFIVNKEYKTVNNTILYLQLDVFNTYYYDIQLMPSFVDRCHVPRWNGDVPTYHMEDEEIGIGEYVQIGQEELYTMNDSIVVTSSVPIGYVVKATSSGGGNENFDTSWENGKLSAKGFRFIKGFEGFAPYKYQDSGGYWTIAYGVTSHGEPSIYNSLVSKQPVSEEEGAKISFNLKNENYASKILSAVKKLGITNQNQFDALVSVAYNCGVGAITGSNSLTNALAENPNDESKIRPIWESFKITSNGITLPGLIARRKQECNMYFGKDYEVRPISLINSNGGISGTVTENNGNGWLPTETTGEMNGYKVFTNDYGKFMCPVKNATVTSKYGWRTHPITGIPTFHHGTDIGIKLGSPTVASMDGTITQTGYHDSMGNYIYLDNEKYRVKYMHLSKITVEVGQTVKRGEKVGEIGSTGSSTGAHCHWEIRRLSDNESTDPAPSLQKGDKV